MITPLFTIENYQNIMQNPYGWQPSNWLAFWDIVRVLRPALISRFASLDGRKLSTDLTVPASEKLRIWSKEYSLKDAIIALKLLMPTLRACTYFFWDVKKSTHLGIDIMLPRWTPLPSFTAGKVTRIKTRDGSSQNEWHCVVVQDARGYFWGYEHLDTISVNLGQNVQQWTTLWLCGKTGNATQYHLHLQVDFPSWSSHPYRSSSLSDIQKYTCDPLSALRAVSPISAIKDLPYEMSYQESILILMDVGILKIQPEVRPYAFLQRYEMALIMHRTLKTYNRYTHLIKQTNELPVYSDVTPWQAELDESLRRLRQYGLMKWSNGSFFPAAELNGEECLALLWRSFFGLKDATSSSPRYQSYRDYFTTHSIIPTDRPYINKHIPRQDIFLVTKRVLVAKWLIAGIV